tara:strand:- start:621 stop:1778 length:1158 start_codon:yes stop_codon:yes gene_type:complete
MGLINVTQQAYYSQSQQFTATGSSNTVTITTVYFPTLPAVGSIAVFIDGKEINTGNYSYNASSGVITFTGNANNTDVITFTSSQYRPNAGLIIEVKEINKAERFGNYRYTSLNDLINNYLVAFVGDGKIINDAKKTDVIFHAKRGIQEFAYDISRVEKIQEIQLSTSLSMPLPQDYIHYVRLSYVDTAGVENIIYPARFTSRPSESILQDDDYKYLFDANGNLLTGTPVANTRFEEFDLSKITGNDIGSDANYSQNDELDRIHIQGGRFGLDPEITQNNGVFVLDELNGKISFSSDLADEIITLKYISDGLGTDDEMQIHKFAEDAMYKYITHAIASTKANMPEYIINRFRKEKRAAMRNAKLRLSSLKLDELTQVMRGKSKVLK